MRNTLTLSNYIFGWYMKKFGTWILAISAVAAIVLLAVYPGSNSGYAHIAIEFRTYDLVVDRSGVFIVFIIGLLLVLQALFLQMNSFYTNGRGMYTLFTLPMKRRQVYAAFFLSAITVVLLYFAVWTVLMVVLYFPVTSMYANLARQAVLYVAPDVTLTGLDTSVTNGLYLALQRSAFLSGCLPTSGFTALCLAGGMLLSVAAVVFAGLYNEYLSLRILMLFTALAGIYVAFYQVWFVMASDSYFTGSNLLEGMTLGLIGIGAALILMLATIWRLSHRRDI